MHSAKHYLLVALSFAICMTVFAAFAPRIAHAITATLVQVVNTSTNPVQTTLTDAQNAFVVTKQCFFGDPPYYQSDFCPLDSSTTTGALYTVPANKIAVIESASGRCATDAGTSAYQFRLLFTAPDGTQGQRVLAMQLPAETATGPSAGAPTNFSVAVSDQGTYAAGGASGAEVDFDGFATAPQTPIPGGTNPTPNCIISLSGHLAPAS